MSRRLICACACALLLCGACRKESDPVPGATTRSAVAKPAEQAARAPTTAGPLDAQGRLRPSGRHIAWLELPVGFEETSGSYPRHHVFEARGVTLEQTRAYLSERMLTGQVQEAPTRIFYQSVIPVSAEAGAMHFDIMVDGLDRGRRVRLTLDELSFLGVKPLPLDQAKQVLAREQATAE